MTTDVILVIILNLFLLYATWHGWTFRIGSASKPIFRIEINPLKDIFK